MKIKEWFKKFLAGIGIGVGAAIPGVSGAAVAVIFKVFEPLIWALNNIFKKFGRALAILVPVVLGAICAMIPCIYLFDKALESFVFGLLAIFAGFLIGSFPGITDEVKGVKPKTKHKILIIIGVIFVVALGVCSVLFSNKINLEAQFDEMPIWLYFTLVPVGIIAAVALTVPGLSGSLIMLIIGYYKPLVGNTVDWFKEGIVDGNWSNFPKLLGMLGSFAIGALIGIVLISKIMKRLLANHHDSTYFAIIGFVLGSIFVLFFNNNIFNYYCVWAGDTIEGINPWLPIYIEIPLGVLLMGGAIVLSYLLVKYNRKNKIEETVEE